MNLGNASLTAELVRHLYQLLAEDFALTITADKTSDELESWLKAAGFTDVKKGATAG